MTLKGWLYKKTVVIRIVTVLSVSLLIGYLTYTRVLFPWKPWKSEEGKVCSWTGCYTSEKNQKYRYWVKQAAVKKDVTLCNNVEGLDQGDYELSQEGAIDSCKAAYAIEAADVSFCHSLRDEIRGNNSQRNFCLEGLAKKLKMPGLCDELRFVGLSPNEELAIRQRCRSGTRQ